MKGVGACLDSPIRALISPIHIIGKQIPDNDFMGPSVRPENLGSCKYAVSLTGVGPSGPKRISMKPPLS